MLPKIPPDIPDAFVSFTVLSDPTTGQIVIDLDKRDKVATVTDRSTIAWFVTNGLLKRIKVSIVGLNQSLEKPKGGPAGARSTFVASGDRGRIDAVIADRVPFRQMRGYAIWVEVGGKSVAVDPDLQVDPPPGGGRKHVAATAPPVVVTIDDTLRPKNKAGDYEVQPGGPVEWQVTNKSADTVIFTIVPPPNTIKFDDDSYAVVTSNETKSVTGTIDQNAQSFDYGEIVATKTGGNHQSRVYHLDVVRKKALN